ncbi:MAG: YjjG family noncanonical pyrimidine nucleotidase [Flavobacteriaceae bacterium]
MLRPEVKHIFFDLDHTLWDFERNSAEAFKVLLADLAIPVDVQVFHSVYSPINEAYWEQYRQGLISQQELRLGRLRDSFQQLDVAVGESVIQQASEAYIDLLTTFTHLMPGTLELLDYLKPNYTLHIITNGFREAQARKLAHSSLVAYFDQVIDSESVGVKKPHPLIFESALQRAAAKKESALMVGDHLEADVLGALSLGWQAVHYDPLGKQVHTHCPIIHDLRTLKDWL